MKELMLLLFLIILALSLVICFSILLNELRIMYLKVRGIIKEDKL